LPAGTNDELGEMDVLCLVEWPVVNDLWVPPGLDEQAAIDVKADLEGKTIINDYNRGYI
jgi:hypothetical protein